MQHDQVPTRHPESVATVVVSHVFLISVVLPEVNYAKNHFEHICIDHFLQNNGNSQKELAPFLGVKPKDRQMVTSSVRSQSFNLATTLKQNKVEIAKKGRGTNVLLDTRASLSVCLFHFNSQN